MRRNVETPFTLPKFGGGGSDDDGGGGITCHGLDRHAVGRDGEAAGALEAQLGEPPCPELKCRPRLAATTRRWLDGDASRKCPQKGGKGGGWGGASLGGVVAEVEDEGSDSLWLEVLAHLGGEDGGEHPGVGDGGDGVDLDVVPRTLEGELGGGKEGWGDGASISRGREGHRSSALVCC